mmetsp:Transcript_118090/g.220762  ORF Transcript_118090/g.220762 Transcript_118090/m.220762 type:complete len:895 (+) Transcript_118090:119-2803(+)
MTAPPRGFPYGSQMPPTAGAPGAAAFAAPNSQVPYPPGMYSHAGRNASFETAMGSTSTTYSCTPGPAPSRAAGGAGYQTMMPQQVKAPAAPLLGPAGGVFPFNAVGRPPTARPLDAVTENAQATQGLPAGGSPGQGLAVRPVGMPHQSMPAQAPAFAAMGAANATVDRHQSMPAQNQQTRLELRTATIEHAFSFVDPTRSGVINMSQNKTGLTVVFEQLGITMPKDKWFVEVFRNYDKSDSGDIEFKDFKDIAEQWDDHQTEKRKKKEQAARARGERESDGMTSLPPPPPASEGVREGHRAAGHGPLTSNPQDADRLSAQGVSSPAGLTPAGAAGGRPQFLPAGDDDQTLQVVKDESRMSHQTHISTKSRVSAAEINADVMYPTYVGRLAIFDDYEFCGDVGVGAFGKVMVVKHRSSKALRACKAVTTHNSCQRRLIETEITLMKALNHPNIVKLHEVYFEGDPEQNAGGNIYLVMELCEGGDLYGRIMYHYVRLKDPMKEGQCAYMMQQILSATQYCHEKEIIHRDIKPENIIFVDRTSGSALKIIDFGLANFTEKIRETAKEVKVERTGAMGTIAKMLPAIGGRHIITHHVRKQVMQTAGTPHYMAPEMIQGNYDSKADCFSIGIILSQLLSGWHPFFTPDVDDQESVKLKIKDPAPVVLPPDKFQHVTREAQQLCLGLLEKDPNRRLSAKQALEHPWFRMGNKPTPFGFKNDITVSIFEGLMDYQAYSKLKRAVLQLLARELSERQIQELRKKFMALDTEGDGLLSVEELLKGMRHVGHVLPEPDVKKIVAALDPSGQGRIGYSEFISALIQRRVKFSREQFIDVFRKFDQAKKGRITYEDVRRVLQGNADDTPGITESEWKEIAAPNIRTDELPGLTVDEFLALMEAPEV